MHNSSISSGSIKFSSMSRWKLTFSWRGAMKTGWVVGWLNNSSDYNVSNVGRISQAIWTERSLYTFRRNIIRLIEWVCISVILEAICSDEELYNLWYLTIEKKTKTRQRVCLVATLDAVRETTVQGAVQEPYHYGRAQRYNCPSVLFYSNRRRKFGAHSQICAS